MLNDEGRNCEKKVEEQAVVVMVIFFSLKRAVFIANNQRFAAFVDFLN